MKLVGKDITSVQYAALLAIAEHQQLEQTQIATLIAYDKATIGGVISRMEKKGWIDRVKSRTDKRAKLVTLTAEGSALLAELDPVVHQLQQKIVQNLTPDEQQTFMALAQKAIS